MLRRLIVAGFSCAIIVAIAGCTRTLDLRFPVDAPLDLKTFIVTGVDAQARTKSFQPGSPECRRLEEWLGRNQSGWSPSLATNPISGVFVTAGELRLQFTSNTAFAFTAGGQFQKEVRHEDYAFLEAAIGI